MFMEFFLLLLVIYFISLILKRKENLPPGPLSIPYFGKLPYAKIDYIALKEKYGNIFTVKYGALNFVYICDFKAAKELFSKPEFSDRPSWEYFKIFEGERRQNKVCGIGYSKGNLWIHNRRFLVHHLQDLGMGKSKIEGLIMREVEELVEEFKGLTKEPSILPEVINVAVANVLWQLVSSHRYDFRDERVHLFLKNIKEISQTSSTLLFIDFYPVVKYIIPKPVLNYIFGREIIEKKVQEVENILQPIIDDHLKTLDPLNPRDLIDYYLIEMKEKKNPNYSHFDITGKDENRIKTRQNFINKTASNFLYDSNFLYSNLIV
ncbi:UNVERIFIED_CONTAM: hypothetical protein RMT77_019453 [Armadillidium vulgare]